MHVTRFGHSAVLVESAGQRILIDPGTFSADEVFELEGLGAIIVTHQHADHLDKERVAGLIERNRSAQLLSDPETATLVDGFTPHTDSDATQVGDVTIAGVGTTHAEILPVIPRIPNTGVLISADGEPTLFHPGDSYDSTPADVDVLALPLSAPWTKISETVAFVQRVQPKSVFPIHDAIIAPIAQGIFWGHVVAHSGVADPRNLGPRDLAELTRQD